MTAAAIWRLIGIRGAIALVLGVALGFVILRADTISNDRETLRNALAAERASHAVTRLSLDTLQDELAKMVRDGELRRDRLAEARSEAQEASEGLRQQAERIRAEGATGKPCVTPEAVRDAEGL